MRYRDARLNGIEAAQEILEKDKDAKIIFINA